jgi:diadenosine tetraphosphate (Ap4A) HIT family hydrolase
MQNDTIHASPRPCPFCAYDEQRVVWADTLVIALTDAYPVSPGHTLVVPRRHVATYFDATPDEQASIWAGVREVKGMLEQSLQPDGYNVGFNAGVAAGQTVAHAHVHVIPRFSGDVDDPRGGVRWVVPTKAAWWSTP